ncbi:MAG TPA: GNAT family N-acetyltransferase, partial [Methylotenera sp.]|nr:GNAT family N-acetyltransferase [Methylotenera sp.]
MIHNEFQLSHNTERNAKAARLSISIARTQSEIEQAQRLRYKVFAEEMGAQLLGTGGLDVDGFDQYCEHLIVRDNETNQVIGTYRILSPERAFDAGGYYSAGEFDLTRIAHLFDRTVEVGRACVHQNYRNGGTITMLWAGLAQYMQAHQYEFMIGCGSISMADGGHGAASLYQRLQDEYLSPLE